MMCRKKNDGQHYKTYHIVSLTEKLNILPHLAKKSTHMEIRQLGENICGTFNK